jgi:hypothetical protein
MMQIIDDWLEEWLMQPSLSLETFDRPGEKAEVVGILAARLEKEAAAEGYDAETLADACGGDLSAFLAAEMVGSVTPAIVAAPQRHETVAPGVL